MSRRVIRIRFVTPSRAYVTGWGSRDLLTELRGRVPVWSSRERAWVALPSTARDAVAAAEARGWDVVVTNAPDIERAPEVDVAPPTETSDEGLW